MALQKIFAVGEKLQSAGDKISFVGERMLSVTAGVTALGIAAVTTAANFESSMFQMQGTMGITKEFWRTD